MLPGRLVEVGQERAVAGIHQSATTIAVTVFVSDRSA